VNALRALHALCRTPGFRELCLDEHKFTTAIFDGYVKEAILLYRQSLDAANAGTSLADWADYVNVCSSMVAFVDVFPERQKEFQTIIPDLIGVIKEKTELARKNSAILLAKLAKDEENSKVMRAHHGHEVLMSLNGALKV